MKILKIFGVVVGIHVFAFILIFANPGCSSTTKPAPQPADTVAKSDAAPSITVPSLAAPASTASEPASPMVTPAPVGFNPDAPATYGSSSGVGVRFTPTRPNTPAASAVLNQPVENVTPAAKYTVKGGDSLWTLGKKFHVSVKEIADANNLRTNSTLHEGQKLIIPKSGGSGSSASKAGASTAAASSSPASAPAAAKTETAPASHANGDEVTYTVKPGESLDVIARRFDVRTRDLAVHNNISDPRRLRPGTVLNIPGWQAKGSKSTGNGSTAKAKAAPAEPAAPPNLLESVPSEPTPATTSTIPTINIDEAPTAPAPKP
jgi:LysM repeat protein